MLKQWKTLYKQIRRYFHAYGGIAGLFGSPFFGLSLIIAILSYSQWVTPLWPTKVETLIPSLLGFSLGTYAVIFSIVGSRLKGALRAVEARPNVSYLETINATFFHFIFVQVFSLIWAILYQGTWLIDLVNYFKPSQPWLEQFYFFASRSGSFLGFLFFVYSILLSVAAAIAVYRLALIRDPNENKS